MRLLSQRSESSRRSKDGGVTDTDDGNQDNGVHDTGENRLAGALNGENEGTGGGIGGVLSTHQTFLVGRHEHADEHQGEDVEDGDSPKDLLDGAGERLSRVGGLGGGEANEFGAGKGKGRGDENTTESLEAVFECARVRPVFPANVSAVGLTADVDDNGEEAVGPVSKSKGLGWGTGRT